MRHARRCLCQSYITTLCDWYGTGGKQVHDYSSLSQEHVHKVYFRRAWRAFWNVSPKPFWHLVRFLKRTVVCSFQLFIGSFVGLFVCSFVRKLVRSVVSSCICSIMPFHSVSQLVRFCRSFIHSFSYPDTSNELKVDLNAAVYRCVLIDRKKIYMFSLKCLKKKLFYISYLTLYSSAGIMSNLTTMYNNDNKVKKFRGPSLILTTSFTCTFTMASLITQSFRSRRLLFWSQHGGCEDLL